MQVITVGGKTYLAEEVVEAEGSTSIKGASQIGERGVSRAAVMAHLKALNVGSAESFTMKGLVSYTARDLNVEEKSLVDMLQSQLKLAKDVAIPQLENDVFTSRVLANG